MVNWDNLSEDEAEFLRLCQAHDLTYLYSDDYTYYEKGNHELKRIQAFAKHRLDKAVAAEIWNTVVDEKLQPRLCEDFYWFST